MLCELKANCNYILNNNIQLVLLMILHLYVLFILISKIIYDIRTAAVVIMKLIEKKNKKKYK